MPTVVLSPIGGAGEQFFNNNGTVLSGGKIYTYAAGTTTPLTTYTSLAGTVANPNPVVLNSAGRVSGQIWLIYGASYKFVIKDSLGNTIDTQDNISGLSAAGGLVTAATIVALKAMTGMTTGTRVLVQDLGLYRYDGGAALTADEVSIVTPATGVGRWLRELRGVAAFPFYNLRDYGAVGDDSAVYATANATALQAALDAINTAGGGTLWIPEGTYRFASAITLRSKVRILGDGSGATILSFTGGSGANAFTGTSLTDLSFEGIEVKGVASRTFMLTSCSRVTFVDVKIRNVQYSGATKNYTAGLAAIEAESCTDVLIDRCDISDTGLYDGCRLYGITRAVVRDSKFNNNGRHGLLISGAGASLTAATQSKDVTVRGCEFKDNDDYAFDKWKIDNVTAGNQGLGVGIYGQGIDNVVVDGCLFYRNENNVRVVGYDDVNIATTNTNRHRVKIVNNTISGHFASGIRVNGRGIIVADNFIDTGARNAIGTTSNGFLDQAVIRGNIIKGGLVAGAAVAGAEAIRIAWDNASARGMRSQDIIIDGNIINDCQHDAIKLLWDDAVANLHPKNVTIVNNRISNCYRHGIQYVVTSAQTLNARNLAIVQGNVIENFNVGAASGYGIQLVGFTGFCTNNLVRGYGGTETGIVMAPGSNPYADGRAEGAKIVAANIALNCATAASIGSFERDGMVSGSAAATAIQPTISGLQSYSHGREFYGYTAVPTLGTWRKGDILDNYSPDPNEYAEYRCTTAGEAAATAWAISTAYVVGDRRYNGTNVYEVTVAGTSAGAGGPTGTGSAIADNTVTWKYNNVRAVFSPTAIIGRHDIPLNYPPGVVGVSAVVAYVAPRALTLPASLTGSYAKATVAATASTTFNIAKNGSNVGSFNFAIGATVATFTFAADSSVSAGDIISIVAPAGADATLANVAVQLQATLR